MIYADIDRVKAKSLGVPLDTIFGTLQASLGSAYVNDFNKFGTHVPGPRPGRSEVSARTRRHSPAGGPRHAGRRWFRWARLVKVEKRLGPQIIPRYNLYPVGHDQRRGGPGLQLGPGA